MKFIKIKIRPILPPKTNIYPLFDEYLSKLKDGDVIFITSKILAIHQGRCLKIEPRINKRKLIKQEAEKYIIGRKPAGKFILSIKEHTLIPTSGIDESNGNGYYILWPQKPSLLAREVCEYLQKKSGVKKLAVIITDSHTTPLRYGVTGISIGFFGLDPVYNYIGKEDIFGRKLKSTKTNIVDALAAMAVLLMGEGKEQTPIVILRNAKFINFRRKSTYKRLVIPANQDIYSPLLKIFNKKNENHSNRRNQH